MIACSSECYGGSVFSCFGINVASKVRPTVGAFWRTDSQKKVAHTQEHILVHKYASLAISLCSRIDALTLWAIPTSNALVREFRA